MRVHMKDTSTGFYTHIVLLSPCSSSEPPLATTTGAIQPTNNRVLTSPIPAVMALAAVLPDDVAIRLYEFIQRLFVTLPGGLASEPHAPPHAQVHEIDLALELILRRRLLILRRQFAT